MKWCPPWHVHLLVVVELIDEVEWIAGVVWPHLWRQMLHAVAANTGSTLCILRRCRRQQNW